MALMLNALNKSWFLIFLYIGGGIPMNAWLMKGYFDTVPISLDESAKLDGAGHFRRFWQIVLPLVLSNDCGTSTLGFHGTFRGLYFIKILLREKKNSIPLPLVYKPSSAILRILRYHTLRQVRFSLPYLSVFYSSSYKRTLYLVLQVVATRVNLVPPFSLLWVGYDIYERT